MLASDQVTPNKKKNMEMQNDNDVLPIIPLIIISNESEVLAILVEVPVLFIPRNECKVEAQVHNRPFQPFQPLYHLAKLQSNNSPVIWFVILNILIHLFTHMTL